MPAMKHSGAFLTIRLAVTVVLLLFSTLLLNILWLIT
jgi:low affinity Fe/Cu permease